MSFLCLKLSLLPHFTCSKSQSLSGQRQSPTWLIIPSSAPPPVLNAKCTGLLQFLKQAYGMLLSYVTGPSAWITLPPDSPIANVITSFKSVLKYHLCSEDYFDHHTPIQSLLPISVDFKELFIF